MLNKWVTKMVISLVFFLSNFQVQAQRSADSCAAAPNQAFGQICRRLRQIDNQARRAIVQQQRIDNSIAAPGVPGFQELSPAVPRPFQPGPHGCTDLQCLCPHLGGGVGPDGTCFLQNGQPLRPALRREIRTLSDAERQRYHTIMQQMKNSGEYDRLSEMHRQVGSSSGAHSGPGFLPWHREFMKRFEISLRLIDPHMSAPYWDPVLDSFLPDPRDSVMFGPMFAGSTDPSTGFVTNGPYAMWRIMDGSRPFMRRPALEGRLMTPISLQNVFTQEHVAFILAYTAPQSGCPFPTNFGALEYAHSSVHLWLGGDMKPPTSSTNDPIFYPLHSFADMIWEQWRNAHQNRHQRETEYPPDLPQCANSQHFSGAQMRPWSMQNRDGKHYAFHSMPLGLSNRYTDFMYQYAPRPSCTAGAPSCGSRFLFCDTRGNAHCVSKIRPGGNCAGFEAFDSCMGGSCVGGRCAAGAERSEPEAQPVAAPIAPPPADQENNSRNSDDASSSMEVVSVEHSPTASAQENSGGDELPPPAQPRRRPSTTTTTPPPAQPRRTAAPRTMTPKPPPAPRPSLSLRPPPRPVAPAPAAPPATQPARPGAGPPAPRRQQTPAPTPPNNAGPPPGRPTNATLRSISVANCFNEDPCCGLWSRDGECNANPPYMNRWCRRSCGTCHGAVFPRRGCFDRHVNCDYWARQGECGHRRQWMAENCRQACGFCNMSPAELCLGTARMSRL